MANLKTYYAQAKPIHQYIDDMSVNKESLLSIYKEFEPTTNDQRLDSINKKGYHYVLIITEDWCTDAMMNNAILKHISEQLNLEVRAFYRDANTDLIDQYLTNGKARAIPIYIFMNEKFEQQAVWGPRAQSVQNFVNKLRQTLPDKSNPDFEDKEKTFHQTVRNRYLTDHTLWNDVYESILKTLL